MLFIMPQNGPLMPSGSRYKQQLGESYGNHGARVGSQYGRQTNSEGRSRRITGKQGPEEVGSFWQTRPFPIVWRGERCLGPVTPVHGRLSYASGLYVFRCRYAIQGDVRLRVGCQSLGKPRLHGLAGAQEKDFE